MKKNILYLSLDGILDSVGDSQILSYLQILSNSNNIVLNTFEKKEKINLIEIEKLKNKLKKKNILWYYFDYPKKKNVFRIVYCLLFFQFKICTFILKYKINILHLRGSALGFLTIIPMFLYKIKLIYDMRGFWADEKADRISLSRKSFFFLFFKNLEKYLCKKAAAIIVLTNQAKKIICKNYNLDSKKINVIRTCVNMEKFNLVYKKKIKNELNLCYLGSIDTAYNFLPVMDLFKIILSKIPRVKFFIFNEDKNNYIKKIFLKNKISKKRYLIRSSQRKFIPFFLRKMDIGLFYLNKNYSIKASMPTKIGEFLSCGVPIICNNFNSDINYIFKKNKIGFLYDFKKRNDSQQIKLINNLKKITDKRFKYNCRSAARKYFDLNLGVNLYQKIYSSIA